jgi:hypothetical protein
VDDEGGGSSEEWPRRDDAIRSVRTEDEQCAASLCWNVRRLCLNRHLTEPMLCLLYTHKHKEGTEMDLVGLRGRMAGKAKLCSRRVVR